MGQEPIPDVNMNPQVKRRLDSQMEVTEPVQAPKESVPTSTDAAQGSGGPNSSSTSSPSPSAQRRLHQSSPPVKK